MILYDLIVLVFLATAAWSLHEAWHRPRTEVMWLYVGGTIALLLAAEWVGAAAWAAWAGYIGYRRHRLWTTTVLPNGIKVTHRRDVEVHG
ncbi:MAG: hypothetical protein EKK65_11135 [Lysobacterales bacterium]|nr:MAG: hypothetical protein EKK65_11135 [Xanthomonadales bacterium]